VLQGLDINGSVNSGVSNVVIQNTRIRCTNEDQWCLSVGPHTVVQDTEIGGGANGSTFTAAIGVWSGGSSSGNVFQRVNIHNTSDGMRIDGGTTIVDSYIHNLVMGDSAAPGAHSDGIQSTGGSNVVVKHNSFQSGNNCNVFVQWLSGNEQIKNYTVTGNKFTAGNRNGEQTSYGVCAYGTGVPGPVAVTNNMFSSGFEVKAYTAPAGATVSGNTDFNGKSV
jgi:hypothetical protein